MREVIQIQAGQCGNNIGHEFLRVLTSEHAIGADGYHVTHHHNGTANGGHHENGHQQQKFDEKLKSLQLSKADVYFNQTRDGKYVPRSILVDLEPGQLDTIRASPLGRMYRPDNFIHAQSGAGNNWAKGHYTEGVELIEEIMDIIRKESDNCDCLQGFQVAHSIGGGTGSGLGTLIMNKVREEYPDRMMSVFSVLPSSRASSSVVEPYNAILSLNQLIENSESVVCLDNEAMLDVCTRTLKNPSPSFTDLNYLTSIAMSGTTCCLRFPGQLNSDLRKLAVNLVPFPRLHFFTSGIAPLVAPNAIAHARTNVPEMVQEMFSGKNMMVGVDPSQGKYITAAVIFRGKVYSKEVETAMTNISRMRSSNFVEWIPNNTKTSICDIPSINAPISATFLGNNSSIADVFARIHTQFKVMFTRKAFLSPYTREGMDELEFSEAEYNVGDLIDEYQQFNSSLDTNDQEEIDEEIVDGLEI